MNQNQNNQEENVVEAKPSIKERVSNFWTDERKEAAKEAGSMVVEVGKTVATLVVVSLVSEFATRKVKQAAVGLKARYDERNSEEDIENEEVDSEEQE